MKKKVRIYKAQDGQGQYINKTAQFLRKAAMGGIADPKAYENDLLKAAYISLKKNRNIKDVYDSFIGQQMPEEAVHNLLYEAYNMMIENGEMNPQQVKQQFDDLETAIAEEEARTKSYKQETGQDEGAEENVEVNQADEDDQSQMNQYRQQSMDIAMQSGDDSEMDDIADDRSYLDFRYGGPLMMNDGGEPEDDSQYSEAIMNQFENQKEEDEDFESDLDTLIEQTPGVQNITFPGVENYLYNYTPLYGDESIDYLQPFKEPETTEPQFKFGGAPSKKSFVKNVMSLLKKAEGGEGDQIEHTAQASPMDNLTGTVKDKKQNFINAVKSSANEAKISEWFDQMKKTGDPMLQDVMNKVTGQQQQPMSEQPQAKRGGAKSSRDIKKLYKAILKAQRALGRTGDAYDSRIRLPYSGYTGFYNMFAGMPSMGAISYPDMMRYYTQLQKPVVHSKDLMHSLEVYDTDIFGRPKRYAIGYGARPSAQIQAKESEIINNIKSEMMLPSDNKPDMDSDEMPEEYYQQNMSPDNPYSDREAIEEGLVPGMQFGGPMTADTNTLAKFMYGQAMDPQMAKNVNDPYDEDLTETDIPEARRGLIARGLRNALVPWNPIFGYAGSWKQQRSLPFYAGTNNPYLGSLQGATPFATHVDKTTFLRRRPKEWTEYYQTPGSLGSFKPGTMYKGSDGQMHYFDSRNAMIENQMQFKEKPEKKSEEPKVKNKEYHSDTEGLGFSARRAIRKGEREMSRNEKRLGRRLEDDPDYLNIPEGDITNFADPEMFNKYNEARDYKGGVDPARYTQEYYDQKPKDYDELSDEEYYNKYKTSKKDDVLESPSNYENLGKKINRPSPGMAKGGVPKYNPGGPTLLSQKPAFDQFKAQCPPGSMKDPQTGLCKNFAGEVVPNNQTATAATTFQQNTQGIGTNNPMAYSGTNNLTGQDAMHFNAQGTGYENKGVADLSSQKSDPSSLVGVKFKKQDMKAVDPEAGVNVFNMGARTATGLINRRQQNVLEAKLLGQMTQSDALNPTQQDYHRGDWLDFGSMLGQYRFDQMGQDKSGFSSYAEYGGEFQDGGALNMNDGVMINEPYPYYPESEDVEEPFETFKEGGEKITYMSEKQIREFLAAGGELEYL